MVLARWQPFEGPLSLRQAMDRLFEEAWVRPGPWFGGDYGQVDLVEDDEAFTVRMAVPGFRPEDIEISVLGNALTVKGTAHEQQDEARQHYYVREIPTGGFERVIRLPAEVNADQAETSFEYGVLTVHLPKAEAAKPRRISLTGRQPAMQAVSS